MREYQFTTNSYRMFAAVTRLCQSPISWYTSGPSQKNILRQIRAMDYSLVDEARREKDLSDKGSFTTHNNDGRIFKRQDTDIALLMLYGHILYASTSYAYALSMYLSISNSTWIVKC